MHTCDIQYASLGCAVLAALWCVSTTAQEADDAAYLTKFHERYPTASPILTLEECATAERYDALYLGGDLDKDLENVTNDQSSLAWGLSYRMMSLNRMFEVTGDLKYLEANLRCIRATMAARDDVTGAKTWFGEVPPAWSCSKYAERGRAVFAVHTGMILYPILKAMWIARSHEDVPADIRDELLGMLDTALESLHYHDPQWRDGPGEGEGHYVGVNQEDILEGKVLPGNRLSAMGRVLLLAHELTGDRTYMKRAISMGHYIRNRLTPSPDGAYYWGYWLPEAPVTEELPREAVKGEDSSHAGLTLAFPLMLSEAGHVFGQADLQRFAAMVEHGYARLGEGILFGDITGNPGSSPKLVGAATNYLPLAETRPELRERLIAYYLRYKPQPSAGELAELIGEIRRTSK